MPEFFPFPPQDRYGVLILDNEVTVGHFVTAPPLAWSRLTQAGGIYRVAGGYPTSLTKEQAEKEMRVWDQVSFPAMAQTLQGDLDSVDYVVLGNNAGQGLPLAMHLPRENRTKSAVIFGESLPERDEYEQSGFGTFLQRRNLISHLESLAAAAHRTLALAFINTIQHDATNFHDP